MSKHKSFCSLVAVAFLCMAVLISPVTANADSQEGLTLTVTPGVTSASLGENISFNYVITSSCNTTVDALVLTDDKLGTISLPSTSLAPGENISISAIYTVALADFPGPLTTTATVTGISADNSTLSSTIAASVTLNPLASSIQVSMAADRQTASAGDNISYTYTITNTGEVNVTQLALTDSRLGNIVLAADNLTPQAVLTATAGYTVKSSDLPGPLDSSATVTALSANGVALTATSPGVSVELNAGSDNDDENNNVRTKAEILRERGVPGKGIDHAPGLQKPFNSNSHGGGNGKYNNTGNDGDNGNGNGNGHGNGKGKGNK